MVITINDGLTNESTWMNLAVIILIKSSRKFPRRIPHRGTHMKFQNSGHVFRVGTAVTGEGSGVVTGAFCSNS